MPATANSGRVESRRAARRGCRNRYRGWWRIVGRFSRGKGGSWRQSRTVLSLWRMRRLMMEVRPRSSRIRRGFVHLHWRRSNRNISRCWNSHSARIIYSRLKAKLRPLSWILAVWPPPPPRPRAKTIPICYPTCSREPKVTTCKISTREACTRGRLRNSKSLLCRYWISPWICWMSRR